MTPVADSGSLAVLPVSALARERLEDGEIIILAIKPSKWLVLLMSWPLIVGVAIIAAVSLAGKQFFGSEVDARMISLICLSAAAVRVVVACMQWLGRLYILTDRRVMRIKGVFREECYQCPLKKVRQVLLAASLPARLVGTADLLFQRTDDKAVPDSDWLCLADPRAVQRAVEEAIRRGK